MKKKISLAWIVVLLCCTLVLIPVLCSVFYFSRIVSGHLETTAKSTASFYIDQYAHEMRLVLDTLKNSAHYLITDKNTQLIMNSPQMPSQLEWLKAEEGLSKALSLNQMPDSNTITGIYLTKDSGQYLSVLRGSMFQGTARRIQDIYSKCEELNSARDLYLFEDYPDYCYFVVDYIDLETMKSVGKIIIEMNPASLIDIQSIRPIYSQAEVILRRTSGEAIVANPGFVPNGDSIPSAEGYVTVGETIYYHTSKSLSPDNMQIALLIPRQEIFQTTHDIVKVSILFTCGILLLTLIIGVFLLYRLYQPFRQIIVKLDSLATGDLTVRMQPTPYREMNQLTDTFNDMADKLEELFHEVYAKELLLKDAEFQLLESQIRPHFIFNVLELINMRCMAIGQQDICRIVSNLAELLRSNIVYKHQQMITFKEELNYVRYYLQLQKERFLDKLDYHIELEDDLILQYYLPKLTIQPLVENSIVHGLENKRGGGYVRILIWEESDAVCIRVADNGIGFSAVNLDLSSSREKDLHSDSNHVALYNINRRIELLYGHPYGMEIDTAPGLGTTILITLPVKTTTKEMIHCTLREQCTILNRRDHLCSK